MRQWDFIRDQVAIDIGILAKRLEEGKISSAKAASELENFADVLREASGYILPIYKGHVVNAKLRQFHLFKVGKQPSIIPFASKRGEQWLKEMWQKGLSMEPVPVDNPEGQKRLEQFRKLNVLGSKKVDLTKDGLILTGHQLRQAAGEKR
jgi:hypothetical protein